MRPELRYVSAESPSLDFLPRPMQHARIVEPTGFGPNQAALLDWTPIGLFKLLDQCDLDNAAVQPVDASNVVDENLRRARCAYLGVEFDHGTCSKRANPTPLPSPL